MKISVIGIGQSLRGDDGIGPEAVHRWSQDRPPISPDPRVETVFLETPGLDLLEYLEDTDAAVLVDAVSSGNIPGTVQVVTSFPETGISSGEKTAHGFGVAETIALARKSGSRMPGRLTLIGIEASEFTMGRGLSEPVRLAIPEVVREIQRIIDEWKTAATVS